MISGLTTISSLHFVQVKAWSLNPNSSFVLIGKVCLEIEFVEKTLKKNGLIFCFNNLFGVFILTWFNKKICSKKNRSKPKDKKLRFFWFFLLSSIVMSISIVFAPTVCLLLYHRLRSQPKKIRPGCFARVASLRFRQASREKSVGIGWRSIRLNELKNTNLWNACRFIFDKLFERIGCM